MILFNRMKNMYTRTGEAL